MNHHPLCECLGASAFDQILSPTFKIQPYTPPQMISVQAPSASSTSLLPATGFIFSKNLPTPVPVPKEPSPPPAVSIQPAKFDLTSLPTQSELLAATKKIADALNNPATQKQITDALAPVAKSVTDTVSTSLVGGRVAWLLAGLLISWFLFHREKTVQS